eukprot:jgi/Ulvmu1/7995/UM004_0230.1
MSTRQTCRAGGQCQTHSVLLAASLRWQELKFTKLSADLASLSHFVLAARPVVTDKVRKQQLKADSETTQSDRHQGSASTMHIGKRERQEQEQSAGIYAHWQVSSVHERASLLNERHTCQEAAR